MKTYLLLFFLLGTLVMIYVMTKNGTPLKTDSTPRGIIDLEFASDTVKTSTVLNAWRITDNNSPDNIHAARINTYLDFIFIFFYAGFLFLAAKTISRSFARGFGRAGKLIAKGALLAGIFDALENGGMLMTLSGNGSGNIAFLTTTCSMIKWGLVLLAVLYAFTGGVALLRSRITGN